MLDLGVMFDDKLPFKEHLHTKINKAYMMMGIIKRNFKYLTVLTLYFHTRPAVKRLCVCVCFIQ